MFRVTQTKDENGNAITSGTEYVHCISFTSEDTEASKQVTLNHLPIETYKVEELSALHYTADSLKVEGDERAIISIDKTTATVAISSDATVTVAYHNKLKDDTIPIYTAFVDNKISYKPEKIFVYLFCLSIVIAALLFAANQTPDKSLFGYRVYTELTPSMTPAYRAGDLIFVKIESADNINVDDVITFYPSGDRQVYLTHRVTQKLINYQNTGVTCFRTKGDANNAEDSFLVDESRVIGTVKFKIPQLGYIVRFIQLRWYFILPLAVMLRILSE
ncbi:MAG: signal peptidase I [Clostridia bacterium]|nr:signal peptidase I [Clostridia bacterium]